VKAIKTRLVELLNSLGLYTSRQYLNQVDYKCAAFAYAAELGKAVAGMSDPARPIVIFADNARVDGVLLRHGQQIIVHPNAKYVEVRNVHCLKKPDAEQKDSTQ
jgi:hypothetical protein